MKNHFSVWKTTVLGGVIFLLPLAIVVFLVGQVVQVIYSVAARFDQVVPDWSFAGVSLAAALAVVLLILLCYVAGVIARLSFGRAFSEKIERNLLLLFPRYAVWKSHLATNVGVEQHADLMQFQPVLVAFDDQVRIGFEIERSNGATAAAPQSPAAGADAAARSAEADLGAAATVTVYLPTSPDPWNGHLVHVGSDRVKPLSATFTEASAMCESMGRGASTLLPARLSRETSGDGALAKS